MIYLFIYIFKSPWHWEDGAVFRSNNKEEKTNKKKPEEKY